MFNEVLVQVITDTNVWQQHFCFCCTLLGFFPGKVSLLILTKFFVLSAAYACLLRQQKCQ